MQVAMQHLYLQNLLLHALDGEIAFRKQNACINDENKVRFISYLNLIHKQFNELFTIFHK